MEGILVRKALFSDREQLLVFEQGVLAAERPFDVTLKRENTHYYNLDELLTAPHIALMVAETEGRLIGSGYARLETAKPYLQHTRYAYLGFMYVVPEHRGKGVNKLVLQELEKWACEQGVTELRLEVYHDNLAAIKAYEKAGYSRLLVEMRKGLYC